MKTVLAQILCYIKSLEKILCHETTWCWASKTQLFCRNFYVIADRNIRNLLVEFKVGLGSI